MDKIKFDIVLGANWGDEGKGLITALNTENAMLKSKNKRVLNVLFSGGAQRGHTVDYTSAFRHVYRHLGAGTLNGADTYMNEYFMVNPIRLMDEIVSLQETKIFDETFIFVNNKCRITTPYDVFINQALEIKRDKERHGSCGLGIYECRKRYEDYPTSVRYGELIDNLENAPYIAKLRSDWYSHFKKRIEEIDYSLAQGDLKRIDYQLNLFFSCLEDLKSYVIRTNNLAEIIGDYNESCYAAVIYEGSQGLALSETNVADFPHLTPSDTTARIPLLEIKEYFESQGLNKENYPTTQIDYITRTYFTRHGADPKFKGSFSGKDMSVFPPEVYCIGADKTNRPNTFQGAFKYAPFEAEILEQHIQLNQENIKDIDLPCNEVIIVTHLNELCEFKRKDFINDACNIFFNPKIKRKIKFIKGKSLTEIYKEGELL